MNDRVLGRALRLAALVVSVVALLVFAESSRANAQGDLPLSLSVLTNNENITAGDIARYTVTLANTGSENLPGLQLTLTLDGQIEQVRLIPDTDASSGVKIDGLRRGAKQIVWRGGLAAGGKLVFTVAARTALIDQEIILTGAAGPVDADPQVTDAAKVIAKAYDLNPNDLSFEKKLLWDDGTGLTESENAEVMPRQTVGIELRLTNNSPATVYTLLVDQMAQGPTAAAEGDPVCRLEPLASAIVMGRGFSIPTTALGENFLSPDTFTYAFLVRTLPGETSVTRVRARVVGTPDCTIEGQARAYSTADGPAAAEFEAAEIAAEHNVSPKLAFVQSLLQLKPEFSAIVAFLILLSDFGDAPDSSNHFTAPDENIPAYVGIDGRFPTVFDPATGLPRGPKHKNGIPVRLGQRISGEFVADLGLWRNLDPPNELADLDLHDDGVDPTALSFGHCLPTTIPFDLTVTQQAVDYVNSNDAPLYLNIWLDGNHDGDWEDSLDCDGLTAVEHIVIDQELRPAAAGTLSLVAPTGNLPVPSGGENREMWLRVTVSDEPSVKTGKFQNPGRPLQEYGDGRGPANGFRWGETEDYLYVPGATATGPGGFGADLDVFIDAVIQSEYPSVFDLGTAQAAAIDSKRPGVAALNIRIRNLGDRTARTPTVSVEMDPYLGIPETLSATCCRCLTCTVAADVVQTVPAVDTRGRSLDLPIKEVCEGDKCRLEIALNNMPPGTVADMVMHYPHCNRADSDCAAKSAGDIEFAVTVDGAGDANSSNNKAIRNALRLSREPVIVSPVAGHWTGCLTCTVAFKGFAEPGTIVSLFSDAFGATDYTALVDERGFWEIDAFLSDGIHQIELGWTGCLTCTVAAGAQAAGVGVDSFVYGEELSLTVDRSLLWNPSSFGYTRTSPAAVQNAAVAEADDSCGPWSIVDDAGRMDLDNWRIPVWPGKEIELGLEFFCDNGGTAKLYHADQDKTPIADFTDTDGDGYFTDTFSPEVSSNAVDVVLDLMCGAQSASYSGKMVPVTPIQVFDRETGNPLPGMTVELYRANNSSESSGSGGDAQFTSWEAHAFGQTNPQTTDAEGNFSYIVPRGRYALVVSGPGYQTMRFGPFRAQGPISGFNIGMPPTVKESGRQAVVQITEDGFLPATLEIAPGTNVEWQNLALDVAGAQRLDGGLNAAATSAESWDSGLLFTGESHVVRFDTKGTYTYTDPADPSKSAIIKVVEPTVVPPSEVGEKVYLPFVLNR